MGPEWKVLEIENIRIFVVFGFFLLANMPIFIPISEANYALPRGNDLFPPVGPLCGPISITINKVH